MNIGDKIRIKNNLEEELLNLGFTKSSSKGMYERFANTEQDILSTWTDEDSGQKYVTVDMCCEVPIQCVEVIN